MKTSLYVIVFKDTKEILTPDSFAKFWKNYGSTGSILQGWRPPKKIYYSIGQAKSGFAFIPEELKQLTEIARFDYAETIEDGSVLAEKQKRTREKRKLKEEAEEKQRRIERARRELEDALKKLAEFGDYGEV